MMKVVSRKSVYVALFGVLLHLSAAITLGEGRVGRRCFRAGRGVGGGGGIGGWSADGRGLVEELATPPPIMNTSTNPPPSPTPPSDGGDTTTYPPPPPPHGLAQGSDSIRGGYRNGAVGGSCSPNGGGGKH